jgi:hypothetical protein
MKLNTQNLNKIALTKQKSFPKLKCIKSSTHMIKVPEPTEATEATGKKEMGKEVEKEITSLNVDQEYEIKRTELKDPESDLYIIVGSNDGLLLMDEKEISEYFDVTPLKSLKLKMWDAPFVKTGMQFNS